MSGWVTFPLKKESERQMPVIFLPALYSKWMLMANDVRKNSKPQKEKSSSIGFYCGLLTGQSVADYPSLTADFPEYPLDSYDAVFLATQQILNHQHNFTVKTSSDTGCYLLKTTISPALIRIRGSFPIVGPFLIARECRYFGFSPYLLKEK